MERQKIILDCDPGHDDAVAITLAANSPQLELLGVTTVAVDVNVPRFWDIVEECLRRYETEETS